eukprot:SAG31_NODE_697_length_12745_cov_67.888502_3_plen_143_part_00
MGTWARNCRWTWAYEDCEVGVSCVVDADGMVSYQLERLQPRTRYTVQVATLVEFTSAWVVGDWSPATVLSWIARNPIIVSLFRSLSFVLSLSLSLSLSVRSCRLSPMSMAAHNNCVVAPNRCDCSTDIDDCGFELALFECVR